MSILGSITNLLTKPNNNILEWHLNYGPSFIQIKTIHREQSLSDGLIIASYILFLARYFYICDERQISVISNFLHDAIKKSEKSNKLAGRIYEIVFKTLNPMERDATIKLFQIYSRFVGLPPLEYSEDEKEPSHSYGKYKFFVFESNGQLNSIFHMSAGPDIILLPITVGILYEYVVKKLRNKKKKESLDRSILDLLETYKRVNCRSSAGLHKLPVEIINQNNIDY